MCIGKGLASGLPLAGIVAKAEVMDWAAGRARLDVRRQPRRLRRGAGHDRPRRRRAWPPTPPTSAATCSTGWPRCRSSSRCSQQVRGRGLMIGIDLPDHDTAEALERACFERGLLVLTCGERSVRMAPPLVVTRAQADTALAILADALDRRSAAGRERRAADHRRAGRARRRASSPSAVPPAPAGELDRPHADHRRVARRRPAASADVDDAVARATEAFADVAGDAGAGPRQPRAPARRAAARAQGRARRAGVDRGRQDPLRGPRRGPGDDRHLRLRRRACPGSCTG